MRLHCHSGTNSTNRSSAVFNGLTLYVGGFHISCMGIQYIGPIRNFVWVFPHHLTEKSKGTFGQASILCLEKTETRPWEFR